jgi:hypothetical protein
MKYYGKYNELGDYVSFFTTEVWKEEDIPIEECIELTEQQWQEGLSGDYKVIDGVHTYSPYTVPEEELYRSLRIQRNKLLAESDWTQLIDSPLTSDKKQEWAAYRQELRNLPNTVDINNIIYPKKP